MRTSGTELSRAQATAWRVVVGLALALSLVVATARANPSAAASAELRSSTARPASSIPTAAASGEVCWLDPQAGPACPGGGPAPLLGANGYGAATPAQDEALRRLEADALAMTAEAHQLDPTSPEVAAAVGSWSRTEAQAALFALIANAVKTPAEERTADQQHAVDWLAGLLDANVGGAGEQAGAEYAAWAGLDVAQYWRLVRSGASEAELRDFLSPRPSPYDDPETDNATGGYCRYRPPSPYQDEYAAGEVQACHTPCSSVLGCAPPAPDYDHFVKWGTAAALGDALTSTATSVNAAQIAAAGTYLGVVVGSTAAAIPLGASIAYLSFFTVGLDLFPWLASALSIELVGSEALALAIEGAGVGVASGATTTFSSVGVTILANAAAIASILAAAVFVIVTATFEGIRVDAEAKLPGKLAALAATSRATTEDPAPLLDTRDGMATLFALFSWATLPGPRGESCDNATASPTQACLNPTGIPAPRDADPRIAVQAPGGRVAVGRQFELPAAGGDGVRRVRISGPWFVQETGDGTDAVSAQTLALSYTDWASRDAVVWLSRDDRGEYSFVGHTPGGGDGLETCWTRHACWTSDHLDYLGADGQRYRAWVEAAAPPVGTPRVRTVDPVEAQPVAFDAYTFRPARAGGGLTFAWRFQAAGCPSSCTTATMTDEGLRRVPAYGEPVAGPSATHTWQTSGTFAVELTATDDQGRSASTTFTVDVGGAAPSVEVDAAEPRRSAAGGLATLRATIGHPGALDDRHVTVDWGDGTPPDTMSAGPNLVSPDGPLALVATGATADVLTATHRYQAGGTYQGSVTVANQAGQTATASFTQQVDPRPQAIAFAPRATAAYGDVLVLDATGGGSGNPVTYLAGPAEVCALTGDGRLELVGVGECSVTARQAGRLPAYAAAPDVTRTVDVAPARLVVTADDAVVAAGEVPLPAWSASGWVRDDSAATFGLPGNTPPTCTIRVDGAPVTAATSPGWYPGAVTCGEATAAGYTVVTRPGALTINPLIHLAATGLPRGGGRVTLDGAPASLPITIEAGYETTHSYVFPTAVVGANGVIRLTEEQAFEGPVTATVDVTAIYQTMPAILRAAVEARQLDAALAATLSGHWDQATRALRAGRVVAARHRLGAFAEAVGTSRPRDVSGPTRTALLAHAAHAQAAIAS